ncbi:MAG: 4-(cytidine 5'-diphospho)-2-C-methyl-D-erythritol kinase [Acidiferrobacteraceae bacterium]|nr:4-(cytidine 5'-diphospho)-2-C-methyl-D-erythritol kinase [Acidiferrobacteraceae bacterium]
MDVWIAPAKINLFLHVVSRRKDGFHNLQTFFQFLEYGDELSFCSRDDGIIRRIPTSDETSYLPDVDLSIKAAQCLQGSTGTTAGVDIGIRKRIPIGAGLGGGSSDAATTLIALNQLWELKLGRDNLCKIARSIGADVPVFVGGRSAYGGGIGDILTPFDQPEAWYCVVVPPVEVLTSRVFADLELTGDTSRRTITDLMSGEVRNDLEYVTCRLYPIVGRCLEWMRGFGDAQMTGSGAGLFIDVPDRARGLEILSQAPSGCNGFVARGINRHPLAI